MRGFADSSEQHVKVLDCVLACKKPGTDAPESSLSAGKSPGKREEVKVEALSEVEQSWKDLDR